MASRHLSLPAALLTHTQTGLGWGSQPQLPLHWENSRQQTSGWGGGEAGASLGKREPCPDIN